MHFDSTLPRDNSRLVARLDQRCLGAEAGVRSTRTRSETSSISRLGGSRWRLRRTRGMRLATEFEFAESTQSTKLAPCDVWNQLAVHQIRVIPAHR